MCLEEVYLKIWLLTSRWEEFEVVNFTKDEDRNYFSENFIGVPIQDWISPLVTIYQEGQQSIFHRDFYLCLFLVKRQSMLYMNC